MAQGASDKQPRSKEACCAEFSRDIQEKRQNRRSKPQPWILLKLAIFLTLAILGFTTYVYVDRFCVPMLTRKPEAMGDRAFGSEPRFGDNRHGGISADSFPSHCSCILGCLRCLIDNDAMDVCQGMSHLLSVLNDHPYTS